MFDTSAAGRMISVNMLRLLTFGVLAIVRRDGSEPPRPRPQRLAILAVLAAAGNRGETLLGSNPIQARNARKRCRDGAGHLCAHSQPAVGRSQCAARQQSQNRQASELGSTQRGTQRQQQDRRQGQNYVCGIPKRGGR